MFLDKSDLYCNLYLQTADCSDIVSVHTVSTLLFILHTEILLTPISNDSYPNDCRKQQTLITSYDYVDVILARL